MTDTILKISNLTRAYGDDDNRLVVLENASLELKAGELVGLIGPSGSGKSTLLHTAGLLERPEAGKVLLKGEVCYEPVSSSEQTLTKVVSKLERVSRAVGRFPIKLLPWSWIKLPIFPFVLAFKIAAFVLIRIPIYIFLKLPTVLVLDIIQGRVDRKRTALRRSELGFIYQFHHLLPEFSAEDNIAVPLMISGVSKKQARKKAKDLLDLMGLANRGHHQPGQLSGGEQQRVAIARALANDPSLIIADEPTGNLDPATTDRVFQALIRMARDEGAAVLVATHNMALTQHMDRVLTLENGKLVDYVG